MLFVSALSDHEGWVLKGGTNLVCRLANSRSTLDLDLFRQGDRSVEQTLAALCDAMEGRVVGRYTFRLGQAHPGGGEDIEVSRLKVSVLDGTTVVETFSLDLSGDIVLNAEPDVVEVARGDGAVLPGYPASLGVRLYPIENQVADKLSAMYSRYGTEPSTRYRDLYDLAMITDQLPFRPQVLTEALATQRGIRGISVPRVLHEPAPGWAAAYNQQMRRTPGARAPFTDYAVALNAVQKAMDLLPAELPGS